MNGFIKQTFALAMLLFRCNALDVNSLKCFSINNTQCKVRPEIININCNEPSFYPYSVKINKSSVVITMPMMHIQKCVFLMLLKI